MSARASTSAAAIAPKLAHDATSYDAAIQAMAATEAGVLDSLNAAAAELVNQGPLKTDEEVEVVKCVREEEVRNCEERSDELRMRQFRSLFDCTSSSSLDIDATITATQF